MMKIFKYAIYDMVGKLLADTAKPSVYGKKF